MFGDQTRQIPGGLASELFPDTHTPVRVCHGLFSVVLTVSLRDHPAVAAERGGSPWSRPGQVYVMDTEVNQGHPLEVKLLPA